MIQIQRPKQFARAFERLLTERQKVRQLQPRLYEVINKAKGHIYHVRITRRNGHSFISCTCEAGCPSKGNRVPVICKHTAAVVLFVKGVSAMRRAH